MSSILLASFTGYVSNGLARAFEFVAAAAAAASFLLSSLVAGAGDYIIGLSCGGAAVTGAISAFRSSAAVTF